MIYSAVLPAYPEPTFVATESTCYESAIETAYQLMYADDEGFHPSELDTMPTIAQFVGQNQADRRPTNG